MADGAWPGMPTPTPNSSRPPAPRSPSSPPRNPRQPPTRTDYHCEEKSLEEVMNADAQARSLAEGIKRGPDGHGVDDGPDGRETEAEQHLAWTDLHAQRRHPAQLHPYAH